MTGFLRATTPAAHAECIGAYTDTLVRAVRSGDLERIEEALEEVRAFRPPHGYSAETALVVALAAQIDLSIPWQVRAGWAERHDPAGELEPVAS